MFHWYSFTGQTETETEIFDVAFAYSGREEVNHLIILENTIASMIAKLFPHFLPQNYQGVNSIKLLWS
jgi:hypothetical protein